MASDEEAYGLAGLAEASGTSHASSAHAGPAAAAAAAAPAALVIAAASGMCAGAAAGAIAVACGTTVADGGSGAAEPPATPRRPTPPATGRARGPARDEPQETPHVFRLALASALREQAQAERREGRELLLRDARRLGRFRRNILAGLGAKGEVAFQWEGGEDHVQIEALRVRVKEQREFIERSRKSLNGRKLPEPAGGGQAPAAASMTQEELDEEIWEQRELCCSKLEAVKRDEAELKDREQRLRFEREEYVSQSRALEVEDLHCFGPMHLLNSRYQLLRLLSRSASTTTYRAYDLAWPGQCVVKMHTLPRSMQEERLQAIIRDCDQLRSLKDQHSGVVSLLDHFVPPEGGSLATVWEHVDGEYLETYLRRNGAMPEKEVRGIALQLLSTLRFVQSKGLRLQAQDLRASRLALRAGEVKVSGVSLIAALRQPGKVPGLSGARALARSTSTLTELEVQPDSVGRDDGDIAEDDILLDWETAAVRQLGRTLHELLFDKSPLGGPGGGGDDMLSNTPVQLPDGPKISTECREFVRKMLDKYRRLSVQEVSNDPFVSPLPRQSAIARARS